MLRELATSGIGGVDFHDVECHDLLLEKVQFVGIKPTACH